MHCQEGRAQSGRSRKGERGKHNLIVSTILKDLEVSRKRRCAQSATLKDFWQKQKKKVRSALKFSGEPEGRAAMSRPAYDGRSSLLRVNEGQVAGPTLRLWQTEATQQVQKQGLTGHCRPADAFQTFSSLTKDPRSWPLTR